MKKMSFSVVAVVVIMVIIIAGEAYAYLPSDRGFSSSATISGDSVDYSVNANGAFVHQAILMDGPQTWSSNRASRVARPCQTGRMEERLSG